MKEINYFARKTMKGFPKIQKNGVMSERAGEATPFLYKGKLVLLQNLWKRNPEINGPCAEITDYFTKELLGCVGGDGSRFYSAYCENDSVYVYATRDNVVYCYISDDLKTWEKTIAVVFPENFELFNTSVCKGDGKYMMAVEGAWAGQGKGLDNIVGNPYIGKYYTEFFVESADLKNWKTYPFEMSYTTERYCACPVLRYCDGYYYMVCLEELPCVRYAPYMYRTKDFDTWEIGLYNPIMMPSEEDLIVKKGVTISDEIAELNAHHVCINNSDVDMCEYEGKTYIVYATGNQGGTGAFNGCTCEATYDGTMEEYLKANFD